MGYSGHGSIVAHFLNTSTGWTRMASLMLWLLYPGKGACGWDIAEVCGACIYVAFACCRCHPWTGECECKPGWDGTMCSRPCPFYTYGKGCRNNCNCKNDAQCSPVNGTCICAAGAHLSGLYMLKPNNTLYIYLWWISYIWNLVLSCLLNRL